MVTLSIVDYPNLVQFGDGNTIHSRFKALISEHMDAIVLPDDKLIEDLISPNPLIDLGYAISLTSYGGWIEKAIEESIPLKRERLKWLIDLETLKCFNINTRQSKENLVLSLHRRMGHPSMKSMITAVKAGLWLGCGVLVGDIESVMKDHPCIACILEGQNKSRAQYSNTDPMSTPIGHTLSGDIIGPITHTARDGSRYFYLFVDRATSYYHVYTSQTKDGFITALKHVYTFYANHGHTTIFFRTDSENLMQSKEMSEFLDSNKILPPYSLP